MTKLGHACAHLFSFLTLFLSSYVCLDGCLSLIKRRVKGQHLRNIVFLFIELNIIVLNRFFVLRSVVKPSVDSL